MGATLWPVDPVAGQPSYTGRRLRQAMSALLFGATAARPLGGRSGIRPGPTTSLLAATSTTWTLGAHAGVVDAELAGEAGPYSYAFDTAQTGAMTPAPSNPNSRIDIVWVRIDDPSESDGSTTPAPVAGYTAGVAAASNPAVPSPPAVTGGSSRYIVIGQILVPFSGSPVVTVTAPFAAAAGGRVLVRSQAERDALAAYNGLCVHRLDTGNVESYHNGWRTELDAAALGAWTAYTPTWTGSSTGAAGVLGTGGSLSGWSQKVGRTCTWEAVMVTGSDASFPAGDFQISLPYQAQIRGALTVVGASLFVGGANVHGDCIADSAASGNKFRIAYHGSAGNAAAANPASWASRTVAFWGRYETTS